MKNLVRNHVTEKDIRQWLDDNGYYGNSAEFHEVELHAVERPGWVQVFRFRARIKSKESSPEPWTETFGVVRDDERRRVEQRTVVQIFDRQSEQQQRLTELSQGLISMENRSSNLLALLFAVAVVFLVLVLLAMKMFE